MSKRLWWVLFSLSHTFILQRTLWHILKNFVNVKSQNFDVYVIKIKPKDNIFLFFNFWNRMYLRDLNNFGDFQLSNYLVTRCFSYPTKKIMKESILAIISLKSVTWFPHLYHDPVLGQDFSQCMVQMMDISLVIYERFFPTPPLSSKRQVY